MNPPRMPRIRGWFISNLWLLITPDGRWLFGANMPGNTLVVFEIDSTTGRLTATGDPVSIPMPSCHRLLP